MHPSTYSRLRRYPDHDSLGEPVMTRREKRTYSVVLLAFLASIYVGPASAGLKVFTCHEEWAVLAETLGGEKVSVFAPETRAPNSRRVQIPGSIVTILKSSDAVLCSSNYKWLADAIKKSGNKNIQEGAPGFIRTDKLVPLDRIEDGHSSHVHYNRYVHSDPKRLRVIAGQTAARFIQLDPDSTDVYRANAKNFIHELGNMLGELEKEAGRLSGKSVVGDVYSYYLLDWLGLKVTTSIEIAEERESTAVIHTKFGSPNDYQAFAKQRGILSINIPFAPARGSNVKTFDQFFRTAVTQLVNNL